LIVTVVRAFVGIGSNLDQPRQHVTRAFVDLEETPEIQTVRASRIYRGPPMGPQHQPDFFNAVAAVDTTLTAVELLAVLQDIEMRHGRVRDGEHWGPRTLDLDLLLYGDQVVSEPNLVVPHPGLYTRAFVLYPLYDVAPELRFPDGRVLKDTLERVSGEELTVVDAV
jgi:2-amino-4-hydroxy-6-hydroxymethyldihydropteridine diphosphokinase